ncbi:MAG: hypothetical protein AB8B55_15955 [Mariniblastus sp.]
MIQRLFSCMLILGIFIAPGCRAPNALKPSVPNFKPFQSASSKQSQIDTKLMQDFENIKKVIQASSESEVKVQPNRMPPVKD